MAKRFSHLARRDILRLLFLVLQMASFRNKNRVFYEEKLNNYIFWRAFIMSRNLCHVYFALMKFQHKCNMFVGRMYGKYKLDILHRMFVAGHKRFYRYAYKFNCYYTRWK